MRTAIISAFLVALALMCAVNPARAQSNQNSIPSHLSVLPANPFVTETAPSATATPLTSGSHDALPPNTANAFGSLNDRSKKSKPLSDSQWRIVPPQNRLQAKVLPPAGTCAHILIHRVWSADSNPMVVQPNGSADRMPSMKGLPVCREDIR